MPGPVPIDDPGSWPESRRLIANQLASLERAIHELSGKLDKFNDVYRDRLLEITRENNIAFGDLRDRIVRVEVQAKMWGARLGLIAGIVGTGVAQLIVHLLAKGSP